MHRGGEAFKVAVAKDAAVAGAPKAEEQTESDTAAPADTAEPEEKAARRSPEEECKYRLAAMQAACAEVEVEKHDGHCSQLPVTVLLHPLWCCDWKGSREGVRNLTASALARPLPPPAMPGADASHDSR